MRDAAASPETVPRDIIDETIIQDTPERRLAVLGEIDDAPGPRIRRKIITIPIDSSPLR